MDNNKYIVVACDCDPDRVQYGGYSYGEKRLIWNGVTKSIPALLEEVSRLEEYYKCRIPFTWNIRSDDQIKQVFGNAGWTVEEYFDIWDNLRKRGDSLCWHPHLWKWNIQNGYWYQEVKASYWIEECLSSGYSAFKEIARPEKVFVHAGWCFQNNFTMKILNELGVTADYSALPGMRDDGYQAEKASFTNFFDWQITSHNSYFPSVNDYRRNAIDNEKAWKILEIPSFTFKDRFLSLGISAVRNSKKLPGLFSGRLSGYVKLNPTLCPYVFQTLINAFNKSQQNYLIIYFHADETLNKHNKIKSLENLMCNIKNLKDEIPGGVFVSFGELYSYLRTDNVNRIK